MLVTLVFYFFRSQMSAKLRTKRELADIMLHFARTCIFSGPKDRDSQPK